MYAPFQLESNRLKFVKFHKFQNCSIWKCQKLYLTWTYLFTIENTCTFSIWIKSVEICGISKWRPFEMSKNSIWHKHTDSKNTENICTFSIWNISVRFCTFSKWRPLKMSKSSIWHWHTASLLQMHAHFQFGWNRLKFVESQNGGFGKCQKFILT